MVQSMLNATLCVILTSGTSFDEESGDRIKQKCFHVHQCKVHFFCLHGCHARDQHGQQHCWKRINRLNKFFASVFVFFDEKQCTCFQIRGLLKAPLVFS